MTFLSSKWTRNYLRFLKLSPFFVLNFDLKTAHISFVNTFLYLLSRVPLHLVPKLPYILQYEPPFLITAKYSFVLVLFPAWFYLTLKETRATVTCSSVVYLYLRRIKTDIWPHVCSVRAIRTRSDTALDYFAMVNCWSTRNGSWLRQTSRSTSSKYLPQRWLEKISRCTQPSSSAEEVYFL